MTATVGGFSTPFSGFNGLGSRPNRSASAGLWIRHQEGTIDFRLAVRHRLGVGAAAGEATLTALGLREYGVDLVHDGITVHPKAHRGKAEQHAEGRSQNSEREYRGHCQPLTSPEKPMNASDINPAVTSAIAAP